MYTRGQFLLSIILFVTYTTKSFADNAFPPIFVIYVSESHAALIPQKDFYGQCVPLPQDCLFAVRNTPYKSKNISVRKDSNSAVDEAGNRFNCDGKYWYDLTCKGSPQDRKPATQDSATVLIDISQSMKNYDPLKRGRSGTLTCHRAEALKQIRSAGVSVRVYGHAENLGREISLRLSESQLIQESCKVVGDNSTQRVFEEALRIHGNSKKPLIMITDASEQTPHLAAFLRSHGGREIFTRAEDLPSRLLLLVR